MRLLIGLTLMLLTDAAAAQPPTTREMNLINWIEFQALVPARIETVLLPTGTLEAHGVAPNGSDNLAPEAMARSIANEVNALIAPTLNYGITGSLTGYAGTFAISPEAYKLFVRDILTGLADTGFKNIIILNGHGGGQPAVLNALADELGPQLKVRILIINWWNLAADETQEIFGNAGGHAGDNENAYMQAITPDHIRRERYTQELARHRSPNGGWSAYPFPSSIILYKEGEGYPSFDADKAARYRKAVDDKVAALITETLARWDRAGLYR